MLGRKGNGKIQRPRVRGKKIYRRAGRGDQSGVVQVGKLIEPCICMNCRKTVHPEEHSLIYDHVEKKYRLCQYCLFKWLEAMLEENETTGNLHVPDLETEAGRLKFHNP